MLEPYPMESYGYSYLSLRTVSEQLRKRDESSRCKMSLVETNTDEQTGTSAYYLVVRPRAMQVQLTIVFQQEATRNRQ